jgi:phosphatidylserine decarboxylase
VNPPRGGEIREWCYDEQPVFLQQGQEMGRFLLGSTVVMLFPKGLLQFNPTWAPAQSIRLGEAMASQPIKASPPATMFG